MHHSMKNITVKRAARSIKTKLPVKAAMKKQPAHMIGVAVT